MEGERDKVNTERDFFEKLQYTPVIGLFKRIMSRPNRAGKQPVQFHRIDYPD